MSTVTKRKKPASGAQNGTKRGRSAGKAGGSKGKAGKRAPEPPAAPTQDDIEEAAAIAQNAYNQAHPKPKPESLASRAARAAKHEAEASIRRDLADSRDEWDPPPGYGGDLDRRLAAGEERMAVELATLPGPIIRGTGGEVALAAPAPETMADETFRDTLESPTSTGAAASRARMYQALTFGEDTLSQALDAAETLGASNSLEKMGAHQFAASHALAMKLMHDGANMIWKGQQRDGIQVATFFNVEGCRLLNMATRLMTVSQGWLSTLARVRQALSRVEQGEYGYCAECAGEISARRLRALPFAVRCTSCESLHERGAAQERRFASAMAFESMFADQFGS